MDEIICMMNKITDRIIKLDQIKDVSNGFCAYDRGQKIKLYGDDAKKHIALEKNNLLGQLLVLSKIIQEKYGM